MSTHTPGPWRVEHDPYGGSPFVRSGDDKTVCRWVRGTRDARLIAAAPELLEALEGLVDAVSNGEAVSGAEAVGFARTIIAKAKGTA